MTRPNAEPDPVPDSARARASAPTHVHAPVSAPAPVLILKLHLPLNLCSYLCLIFFIFPVLRSGHIYSPYVSHTLKAIPHLFYYSGCQM